MAKKPRKSMDDPRNWGGSGDERGRKPDARGDDPRARDRGRRDPRSIGAPQQAPVDWGDFEWTPPRETRPSAEAAAPAETAAAGAWKEFDTMYPEPEPEAPAAPGRRETAAGPGYPGSERTASAGASPGAGAAGGAPGGAGGQRREYHSYRSAGGPARSSARGSGGGPGRGGDAGGPPDGAGRADGRRLVPAGSILIAMVIGLVLAALLNAQSLKSQAEAMQVGTARSIMLALVKPVVAISSTLRIDEPRAAIESALGRGTQEQAGVHTRTPEPTPSAKPSAKPSPGKTASPKPSNPATGGVFTPTKDHQLALWVGGDSMAMVFGESVIAMADRTGLIESALDYHVSSGLSRPDFFDWPARIKAEMKSFQPDVAVFASGANDGQSVEYEGQVLQYGSKEWIDLYHQRVGAAMDLLGGDGARQVWWVGMPIARDPQQSAIYKTMNQVYVEEAKKRPFVHYLDTYEMFSDQNGNYNDYLPGLSGKTELMRQGDGIHWSRAGGDLAAAALLEQIAKVYKFDFKP